jgi:hypothetical protein
MPQACFGLTQEPGTPPDCNKNSETMPKVDSLATFEWLRGLKITLE